MKVRIEMPADQYDQLLRASEQESPEFRTLIAACIDVRQNGGKPYQVAEILCVELANRHSLDAAKAIVRSLRLHRED
jgi:hypothetical protein